MSEVTQHYDKNELIEAIQNYIKDNEQLRAELAAAQARIQELEAQLDTWQNGSLTQNNRQRVKLDKAEAENAQLKAALQPFAEMWQDFIEDDDPTDFAATIIPALGQTELETLCEGAYNALNNPASETDE